MENAKEFFSNVGGKMSSIGGSVRISFSMHFLINFQQLKEKAGGSLGTVKGSLGSMFTKIQWGKKEATAAPAEAKEIAN